MPRKKDPLEIKLVQTKPHKVFKADINEGHHIKDLCKFLRENKDREVGVVINGKHTKFNSHVGKKRFATGYEQGSDFIMQYAKELFEEMQAEINTLKAEAKKHKSEVEDAKAQAKDATERLRSNEATKQIRQKAFMDRESEINEDRVLLKSRLEQIEPIIRLMREAKRDGDLQKAYRLARKIK